MRTKIDMTNRYCAECGGTDTYIHKTTLRPIWHLSVDGCTVCAVCHRKIRKKLRIYSDIELKTSTRKV